MTPRRFERLTAFDRFLLLDALSEFIDQVNESGGSATGQPPHKEARDGW